MVERPAIPREHVLQAEIDRSLRARSGESQALSRCDTCWTKIAPGVPRCDRCRIGARLATMTEGARVVELAKVGLLEWVPANRKLV
jgi:hypothetical protein